MVGRCRGAAVGCRGGVPRWGAAVGRRGGVPRYRRCMRWWGGATSWHLVVVFDVLGVGAVVVVLEAGPRIAATLIIGPAIVAVCVAEIKAMVVVGVPE